MPRNVPDPPDHDSADVVAFPTAMASAIGSVEGVHVEVHLASHPARASAALTELGRLARSSPTDGDVLMRIAVAADLLTGFLATEGIRCIAMAIGTSLATGAHAGTAAFRVAESSVTSAVVVDHEGNRSAVSTIWDRAEDNARTALTVRSSSAAASLRLARQARDRPAVASVLFSAAEADGWFIYPDGRIESCA